jgi:uncharacterized protein
MEMAKSLNAHELKVPVTSLLKKVFTREKLTASLNVAIDEHGLKERGEPGGLRLELWLESSPDGIRVKGEIKGYVSMACTRCLEEYRQEMDIAVDEFYRRPGLAPVGEDGRHMAASEVWEEDDYVIREGVIDLNVLVNDAVLLSLPIRHLCREDCRGLCQVCGANLNFERCGCRQEVSDPRLEVLRTLLDREED